MQNISGTVRVYLQNNQQGNLLNDKSLSDIKKAFVVFW